MRKGENQRPNATSCIVHSLPLHLKVHAYALQCQQPEALVEGETKVMITIDSSNLELVSLVTEKAVAKIDLILRQPILKNDDIILKVGEGVAKLLRLNDMFSNLTLSEDCRTRMGHLVTRTVLVPDTMTMVDIALIDSASGGIWTMPAKVMKNGQSCVAVTGCVLRWNRNTAMLGITNLGEETVEWSENMVLRRAEL